MFIYTQSLTNKWGEEGKKEETRVRVKEGRERVKEEEGRKEERWSPAQACAWPEGRGCTEL